MVSLPNCIGVGENTWCHYPIALVLVNTHGVIAQLHWCWRIHVLLLPNCIGVLVNTFYGITQLHRQFCGRPTGLLEQRAEL